MTDRNRHDIVDFQWKTPNEVNHSVNTLRQSLRQQRHGREVLDDLYVRFMNEAGSQSVTFHAQRSNLCVFRFHIGHEKTWNFDKVEDEDEGKGKGKDKGQGQGRGKGKAVNTQCLGLGVDYGNLGGCFGKITIGLPSYNNTIETIIRSFEVEGLGRKKNTKEWRLSLGKAVVSLIIMSIEMERSLWIFDQFYLYITYDLLTTRVLTDEESLIIHGWDQASIKSITDLERNGLVMKNYPLQKGDYNKILNDAVYARDAVGISNRWEV